MIEDKSYIDFVYWLQAELQCMRLIHPRLALGVPTLSDHEKVVAWALGKIEERRYPRVLTPPLLVIDGGERLAASTLWQHDKQGEVLGSWLLGQSYFREMVFRVLSDVGVPDLASKFPAAALREMAVEIPLCRDLLEERFGAAPWHES